MIQWVVRSPWRFFFMYVALILVLAMVLRLLLPDVEAGPGGLGVSQLIGQALLALVPLPFAAVLGWREVRLTSMRPARLAILAFPLATIAFGYVGGFRDMTAGYVATAVAVVLLVGFGEELAFRGVLMRLLLKRGVGYTVAVSSILFGLMHLVNFAFGMPWPAVALQVLFAGMTGVGFAAMTLRTGSLWPTIVLHAAYNLAFRVGAFEPFSLVSNMYYLLNGMGWVLFAIVVLRPSAFPREPEPLPA